METHESCREDPTHEPFFAPSGGTRRFASSASVARWARRVARFSVCLKASSSMVSKKVGQLKAPLEHRRPCCELSALLYGSYVLLPFQLKVAGSQTHERFVQRAVRRLGKNKRQRQASRA